MHSSQSLLDILSDSSLSQLDLLLLCLAEAGGGPIKTAKLRETAVSLGLPNARKWNISTILKRGNRYVSKLPSGWQLTASGKLRIQDLGFHSAEVVPDSLREAVARLSDDRAIPFVNESISCLEAGCFRAAIILSWIGALSVLYSYVLSSHLDKFNAAAKKRVPKWKDASSFDDLSNMRESTFLEVLCDISILGKSTKQELENCLKLRNACGHPNTTEIGPHRTRSHLETLILNVYTKY